MKIKNSLSLYHLSYLILLFPFLFISLSLDSNPFTKAFLNHDSSMFYYFGEGIAHGLIPYKDMFDHKGPVLFVIEYLATLISGQNSYLGLFIIEIIFLALSLLFIYKSTLLLTKQPIVSALSVALIFSLFIETFQGGNLSEVYALTFISISLYIFLKIILKISIKYENLELIAIGLLGSMTFFIRANMISLWAVFCIALLFVGLKEKNYSKLIRQTLMIFLGGFSVLLIVLIYAVATNSLNEMITQVFVMNAEYSSVTLSERINTSLSFYGFIFNYGVPFFSVLYILYLLKSNKNSEDRIMHITLIATFILNWFTVVLSGRFYYHYLITQLPLIVIFIGIGISYVCSGIMSYKKVIAYGLFILIPILPTISVVKANIIVKNTAGYTPNQIEQFSLAKYIQDNSNESDNIYVHNIDANLYLLSNRFSNSKFFVLPAINYNNEPALKQEFAKSLDEKEPKFIIVKQELLTQNNLNDEHLDLTVSDKIKKKYTKVEVSNNESQDYQIFKIR